MQEKSFLKKWWKWLLAGIVAIIIIIVLSTTLTRKHDDPKPGPKPDPTKYINEYTVDKVSEHALSKLSATYIMLKADSADIIKGIEQNPP